MTFFRPLALSAITLLWACAGTEQERPAAGSAAALASPEKTPAERGLAFAQAQCSGCHAVQPGTEPPNPQAPSFEAVANELGFSQTSLREFFVDKHDTPDQMLIELDDDAAEIVTAYIMSLRKPR